MIKAIIFDLDGVLVDATDWHYEALNQALRIFGFEISREDHLSIYNGLPTVEKLKLLSRKQGLPAGLHPIIQKLKRIYTDEEVALYCKPSHEKQVLLSHLKRRNYKLACCSNAQKYSVMNMLTCAQIDRFFDLILGNDEGYKPKPAPDIYLAAFKKLAITPKQAVIIEDTPYGIKAAKASGAHVIEVRGFDDVGLSLLSNIIKW